MRRIHALARQHGKTSRKALSISARLISSITSHSPLEMACKKLPAELQRLLCGGHIAAHGIEGRPVGGGGGDRGPVHRPRLSSVAYRQMAWASVVLPVPGGPIKMMCLPLFRAAAIWR